MRWFALARRFSVFSIGSVAVLAVNGFLDAAPLVGSWTNLVNHPYGRWLLLKIALFAVALGLAAVNLIRLEPRLATVDPRATASPSANLLRNVRLELILGAAIIVVVAILGILPLPME